MPVIMEAYCAGARLFGENRVQEAQIKYPGLPEDIELHCIGHLQRNKAKTAADLFSWVQSIDKLETAATIEKYCADTGKIMNILLEVNTSGEAAKQGFLSERNLFECLEGLGKLPHIRLRGLMTIGPLGDDTERIRSSFRKLKLLFEQIRAEAGRPDLDTLSMGMSSDFETAVEEGATLVRIGSLLFGAREPVK
ncbi:MAG: YggS family pyridoxal phosphate-dependent enzyme [Spirochaetales bacterium]|nr:MAG: YggS family pyridoxal phosphate-dependent enzyme [Spirochaetales bacterium]